MAASKKEGRQARVAHRRTDPPAPAADYDDDEPVVDIPADERIVLPTISHKAVLSVDEARDLTRGLVEKKKIAYILALAQLGNRTRAAQACGISRMAPWQWLRDDPAFKKCFAAAMEIASDLMEDEMYRRAAEGVLEPVFQQGRLVGSIRKFSDTLLIFGLKGAKPDKYAERTKNEHTFDVSDRLRRGRERALGRGDGGSNEE